MPMSRARTAICSAPLECPSRPGLPTRIFEPAPERLATRVDLLAQRSRSSAPARGRLADAGRRAELAEGVAQRRGPLAGGRARAGGGERRGHDVLVAAATRRSSASAASTCALVARRRHATTASRCWASSGGSTVRMPPSAALDERRALGLGSG
jgi:hypothetical protein